MKRTVYTVGLIYAALGFLLAAGVLAATTLGHDPSLSAPWLWRLQVGALGAWGLMFLVPGIFAIREKVPEGAQAPPEAPHHAPTRRLARVAVVVLLLVAGLNFWAVMQTRTGVTATTADERAAQYALSRLYSLRTYAGFWLVLYGVPFAGFAVLRREATE